MRGGSEMGVSYADYVDWRERSRSFADLAFFHANFQANISFASGTETAQGTTTTWNLFRLLGVHASLLIAVVLLASWIASRAATQVDPLIAIRYE